jgi:hypothetical protein
MRKHQKHQECTGIYSVVPGTKSPNQNRIREFPPEFCQNLQPSHTPTCARMAKMNHVWPATCPSRSVMPGLGLESTQSVFSCLSHTNICQNGQNESCSARSMPQQVSQPQKAPQRVLSASSCLPLTIMFKNGENGYTSCLDWARKAPRVPQAAGHTPTCASCLPHTNICQKGQNESCLARSMPQQVSYATCLDWARKSPRVPPAASHSQICARMAKLNHVWPAACPSRSFIPPAWTGLGKHPECLQQTATQNICQKGQNESCIAHSRPQQVIHASCLDWAQKAPRVPPAA